MFDKKSNYTSAMINTGSTGPYVGRNVSMRQNAHSESVPRKTEVKEVRVHKLPPTGAAFIAMCQGRRTAVPTVNA